jgi:hypothetical protein
VGEEAWEHLGGISDRDGMERAKYLLRYVVVVVLVVVVVVVEIRVDEGIGPAGGVDVVLVQVRGFLDKSRSVSFSFSLSELSCLVYGLITVY